MIDSILTINNWIISLYVIFLYITGDVNRKNSIKNFLYFFIIIYIVCFVLMLIVSNVIFHAELFSYKFSPITNLVQKAILTIYVVMYLIYKYIYSLIIRFDNSTNKQIKLDFKPEFLLDMILIKLFEMKSKNIEKQKVTQYCSYIINQRMEVVRSTLLYRDDIFDILLYIFSKNYSLSLEQFKKLIISRIPNELLKLNTTLGVSKEKLEENKKNYVLFMIDIFCYIFIENNIDNKDMWSKLGLYNPWEKSENNYNDYLNNLNNVTSKRIEYYYKCKNNEIQDMQIYELINKEIPFKTAIERVWFLKYRRL